ncbi:hypothetical protein VTO73DRAFT_15478 [Trametes versicolor]
MAETKCAYGDVVKQDPGTDDVEEACAVGPASVNWFKIDILILPVVTMMFFLSSLDRSNIGNAQVAGLQEQLRISDNQVRRWSYVHLKVDVKVHPVRNPGLVHNYAGLLACRFFLGLFEGGLLPGLALYLSSFYPRRQLQLRISIVFAATSLASAFSGLLAAAIVNMDGVRGRPGWAWLFILEGLFTVVFGIASFFLLPNDPTLVPSLSADERSIIADVLQADGIRAQEKLGLMGSLTEVLRTCAQPQVIFVILCGFFNGTPFYFDEGDSMTTIFFTVGTTLSGLSYYLPSIVVGLGWSNTKAQLMSVPPFATSALRTFRSHSSDIALKLSAVSIITSIASDRYSCRGLTTIFFALLAAIGFSIFIGSFDNHVRYGSLFLLVPGTFAIGPPLGAWAANNSSPFTRRATALAMLSVSTNLGGILSTWLFGAISPAPRYTSATIILLVFQVAIVVFAVSNVLWLSSENRRKRAVRLTQTGQDGGPQIQQGPKVAIGNDNVRFTVVAVDAALLEPYVFAEIFKDILFSGPSEVVANMSVKTGDINETNAHLVGLWLQLLATGACFVYLPHCVMIFAAKLRNGLSPWLPAACFVIFAATVIDLVIGLVRTYQGYAFNGIELPNPAAVYADPSSTLSVLKNAMNFIVAVVSDAIIVYRAFIVWNNNYWVILVPFGLLLGDVALGIWATWTLAQTKPGAIAIIAAVSVRVRYFFVITFVLNILCAAGFYCAHLLILIITNGLGSNFFFLFLDPLPPVGAYVFSMLIVSTRQNTASYATGSLTLATTVRFRGSRSTRTPHAIGVEFDLERVSDTNARSPIVRTFGEARGVYTDQDKNSIV